MPLDRPRIAPSADPTTKWLRRAGVLVSLALAAWAVVAYFSLPLVIPVHFGISGQPDAYGHRSSVLWLALVFVVLTVGVAVMSRHPRLFNYPVPVTDENAERLYREGERMLVWLLAPLQVIFFAVIQAVLQDGAVTWLMWVGLAGLFVVIIASVVRMSRLS
jgi:uncharacterized membrane protein